MAQLYKKKQFNFILEIRRKILALFIPQSRVSTTTGLTGHFDVIFGRNQQDIDNILILLERTIIFASNTHFTLQTSTPK